VFAADLEELKTVEGVEHTRREKARADTENRRALRSIFSLEAVLLFQELLGQAPQLSMLASRMDGAAALLEDLKQRLTPAAETLRLALAERCDSFARREAALRQELSGSYHDGRCRIIAAVEGARKLCKGLPLRQRSSEASPTGVAPRALSPVGSVDPVVVRLEELRQGADEVEVLVQQKATELIERFAEDCTNHVAALEDLLSDFYRLALAGEVAFHGELRDLASSVVAKYSSTLPDDGPSSSTVASDPSLPSPHDRAAAAEGFPTSDGELGSPSRSGFHASGAHSLQQLAGGRGPDVPGSSPPKPTNDQRGVAGQSSTPSVGNKQFNKARRRRSSAIKSALAVESSRDDAEYLMLISNPAAMMEVVGEIHDTHESLIMTSEQNSRKQVHDEVQAKVQQLRAAEFDRSRTIMLDVLSVFDNLTEAAKA